MYNQGYNPMQPQQLSMPSNGGGYGYLPMQQPQQPMYNWMPQPTASQQPQIQTPMQSQSPQIPASQPMQQFQTTQPQTNPNMQMFLQQMQKMQAPQVASPLPAGKQMPYGMVMGSRGTPIIGGKPQIPDGNNQQASIMPVSQQTMNYTNALTGLAANGGQGGLPYNPIQMTQPNTGVKNA